MTLEARLLAWLGLILTVVATAAAVLALLPFFTGKATISELLAKEEDKPRERNSTPIFAQPSAPPPVLRQSTPPPMFRESLPLFEATPQPQGLMSATPKTVPLIIEAKKEEVKEVKIAIATPVPMPGTPAPRKAPTFTMGSVNVSVDSTKLNRSGTADMTMSFTNTGQKTLWIIPALENCVQGLDETGADYRYRFSYNFGRSYGRDGLRTKLNKFLELDPGIPAIGILSMSRSGRRFDPSNETVSKIRVTARFTIVDSMQTYSSREHSFSGHVPVDFER